MATVTSTVGSAHPDTRTYNVRIDNVVTSSTTTYEWESWTTVTSGAAEHRVTLLGAFTYDGMGNPSGTVAQVLLDVDADGTTDLTIAYSSLQAGLLADLTSGDADAFFGAAFFQNDTMNLAGEPLLVTGLFALGCDGPQSDDTVVITGYGTFTGDAENAVGASPGGHDTFTVTSTNTRAFASTTIYGDSETAFSDAEGGNDTIADTTTQTDTAFTAVGDFAGANGASTIGGGDDVLSGTQRDALLVGDIETLNRSNLNVFAGDDSITGGSGNDSIYGDFQRTVGVGNTFTLTAGSDTLNGGAGDDTIWGEGDDDPTVTLTVIDGHDTLNGGAGDDLLFGNAGNDVLIGGDHDDTLNGGEGQDSYDGDDGVDWIDYGDSLFAVKVVLANPDQEGNATVSGVVEQIFNVEGIFGTTLGDTLTGSEIDNFFVPGGGNDTIVGTDGHNTVVYESATNAVRADLGIVGVLQAISADQGSDLFVDVTGIVGSDFNDTLLGSAAADSIEGGAGDDIILARSLAAGAGASGADTLMGGMGSDTVGFAVTGLGEATPAAGAFISGEFETLLPSSLANGVDVFTLLGLTSNYSIVYTGPIAELTELGSSVVLATLGGFEEIASGNGNDFIQLDGVGAETIFGFDGDDTILADALDNALLDFKGGEGDDSLVGARGDDSLFGDDGNDTLIGNAGEDFLVGGEDDDSIAGGEDGDLINGNAGNDTLNGADDTEVDTVFGGDGDDRIVLSQGSAASLVDQVSGGANIDTAVFNHFSPEYSISSGGTVVFVSATTGGSLTLSDFELYEVAGIGLTEAEFLAATFIFSDAPGQTGVGTSGADIIFAGLEVDVTSGGPTVSRQLEGLGGDDYLTGARGNDTLLGGAGNDTLVGGGGFDSLEGGADADVIRGGDGEDTAVYAASEARVEINLALGTGTGGHADGDTLESIEGVIGSAFNDRLIGSINRDELKGGAGNDNLTGLAGTDFIFGGAGDDLISGGNDLDALVGDDGADQIFGNGGDDLIFGDGVEPDAGDDTIFGGAGNDSVGGGAMDDQISGQSGLDTLFGDAGEDTVRGGSGNDSINGGADDDLLFGNGNNDTLEGETGDDVLQGAAGFDSLSGGEGNDTLTGGLGADTLDGGTGNDVMNGGLSADRFIFAVGYDEDRINAFEQVGADKLVLDDALWSGTPGLTGQQVIDMFGTLNAAGTILTLDFGGGDILEVQSAAGLDETTLGADVIIF